MRIRAVLFDLDGTLLDTIEDLTDAMNAALGRLGFPGHSSEACKLLVGDGVEQFALRALPRAEARDEALVSRCVGMMREEYRKRWAAKTRPYDGIAELLDVLSRRMVPMAVLSNKADDFTKMMVAHFFPGTMFAAVLGARPDVPRKPDPTSALRAAAAFGCPPCEVLFLGDTGTDMKTAVAAGMYPVGALWGFRGREELLASGAKELIRRPQELLALVAQA